MFFASSAPHDADMRLAEHVEQLCRYDQVDQALILLEQRVARGEGDAALILGQWRVAGIHVPRDFAQARAHFEQAVALGCDAAETPLIALLSRGAGNAPRDWPEARQRLAAKAENDADAARQIKLLSAMRLDADGDPVQNYRPEFVSHDPLVVRFSAFLSTEECEALVHMAQPKLAPAKVVHPATGELVSDPVRTSLAAVFSLLEETPFLHAINRRIAAASRSQAEQGEPTQILAYHPGQQYHLHSDALPGEANQRIQTFLVYLTDDFEGGATYFPAGELSLRPTRGDAICFSNVDTAMRPAVTARHAGLPVTRGTKFLLSRWIRRYPLDLGGPS